MTIRLSLLMIAVASLAACANPFKSSSSAMQVDNAALPAPVRVPAGDMQKLWTRGVGEITYECRAKKDMADQFEWAFVGPVATLYDARKSVVGKYYAGPTWEANDGSKVTGKQVAVSPAAPGSIALQLVKAEPATGAGAMQGVSHIQRLNTRGGVPPAAPCLAATTGQRQQVAYEADYVFYMR
jgi:hypothetical protein